MTNRSLCVFTIASKNYISQVRTLLSSVAKHHPEASVYLVLCDQVDGYFEPSREPFAVIPAHDLGISRFEEMAFKYSCVELNTAIKPAAIETLLYDIGFERVVYLDPDILVYRPLGELLGLLDHHDVVLTPHLTDFLPDDGCLPDNLRILQTGINNLGFVAVRRSEQAARMLRWWKRQLHDRCRHAITEGLFVDQKWMDLVPSCIESATLLRHPGYNVAYWNLASRRVTLGDDGRYLVNGEPLGFFHFSGYHADQASEISQYDNRLGWGDVGKAGQALFQHYRELVLASGYSQAKNWPYAYARFHNGVAIPECFRAYFHKHWAGQLSPETQVFGTSSDHDSLYQRFQSPVTTKLLTAGAMALYEFYPDLQSAFPRVPGKDEGSYARWFVGPGGGDSRLEATFIEPVRRLLKDSPTGAEAAGVARTSGRLRRACSRAAGSCLRFARRRRDWAKLAPKPLRAKVANLLRRIAYLQPSPPPRAAQQEHLCDGLGGLEPKVNVFGLLDRPTGVGEGARGMVACFEALRVPLRKVAFDEEHLLFDRPLPPTTRPDPKSAINYCHVNADCTAALRHLFGHEPFAGRLNIGYWAWEQEEFPQAWDSAFDYYHEIWVPSTFVQQAVAARARVPVVRIPHCITPPSCLCGDRVAFGIPAGRPAILCMFDTGSYSGRKNPLGAIEAVKLACGQGCDPLLVLKIGRPELERGLSAELRSAVKHIDCHIIEGWLSREQTWRLIGACDVLLSLHRSEGFGLILAEAMALGKPVIATGYSGNMDFMNVANSFPVKYHLTTIRKNVGPYPAGTTWAEPDASHAADLIRTVLRNPEQAKRVGYQAAIDIARHFSVEAVAQRIGNRLGRLGFAFPAPAFSHRKKAPSDPAPHDAEESFSRKAA